MVWRIDDPQGDAAAKVKYLIVPYTRGIGADVGCGPRKAFPHFIGVDSRKDTALFGIPIVPDIEADVAGELPFEAGELDFVFSSHTLEHIADYRAALAHWWRAIRTGGHLVLYLPHRDHYPRIGEPGANPDHRHDFAPEDIVEAMRAVAAEGWDLVENEVRTEGREYSFLQVYRKADDGEFRFSVHAPRPIKTACVVRYGGFGDQLQAANILPALKRQGYHVTFMTTPKGRDVIAHDPHVDAWIIQDNDQVPNAELWPYWRAWEGRFTKFVNLSESVEGTLLAMPGRANHAWPDAVRRKRLGINYLELAAEIAGVPYRSEARFYPSQAEDTWAAGYIAEHFGPDAFVILWALSGSSHHKAYPWQDNVMAKVLRANPQAVFVLVGDEACQILEQGWELEPRVRCESGRLSIRETLTLASMADCVVGPETGVLNAVGFEPGIGKVCLLSHSSVENLTKHWRNAVSVTPPEQVKCYPCHRLHYTSEFCSVEPESGAALCQYAIDPARVAEAIGRIYKRWRAANETRAAA